MSTATTDFADPQAIEELYPMLAELRDKHPVAWSDRLQGWIVTRYADVLAALRNPALSSNRVDVILNSQLGATRGATTADYERITRTQMLFRDGMEHHRLRVLGNQGFTPSMLAHALPMLQTVIDVLIDEFAQKQQADIVADFSQPLPAKVIAELFDIPAADREQFQAWADGVIALTGFSQGDPEGEAQRANEGMRSLEQYFLQLLPKRREHPGHDLMSLMLSGESEGRLTAEEVCSQCILILVAGHVTTIDQLANAVYALLVHREQWELLCQDSALAAAAVEEAMRFDSAVSFIQRRVNQPTQIGQQEVRPGEAVWICPAAANRDPAVFAEPDRFDIQRESAGHMSFGAGPHICLGAGLARKELEIALATLSRRLPRLRLDQQHPPTRRCASLIFRGFKTFPVRQD
jgi:cytochrome P450 PksS